MVAAVTMVSLRAAITSKATVSSSAVSQSGLNRSFDHTGNVPIHDWTLEETLSGVVMQSELLLISRNMSAIKNFLPHALRTSNLIEGRMQLPTLLDNVICLLGSQGAGTRHQE